LPQQKIEEDNDSGDDPREQLVRQLLEYKKYREAASKMRVMEFNQNQVFTRTTPPEIDEGDDDIVYDVTVFDLMIAFKKILKEKSFRDDYEVTMDEISIKDKINFIMDKLSSVASVTFEELLCSVKSKLEAIGTFLGLLELMKLNLIKIQQIKLFGPIRIFKAQKEILNG
jgi:segregation and condensation protein A